MNLPRVTEILQSAGLTDFSMVPQDVLEASRLFGSAGHRMCELLDRNMLAEDSLSPSLLPYLAKWRKLKADYDILSFLEIEREVTSTKWRFYGHLDRLVLIKNRLILWELKFTNTMQWTTGIQLAGYKIAYEEMTKQKIRERWGVQFTDDSSDCRITIYDDPSDESVFLSALNICNRKRRER